MNFNFKMFKSKKRYVVRFAVKEGSTYNFISAIPIKPDIEKIKFGTKKEREYAIDIENPTYRIRETLYYCIDINANQMKFEEINEEDAISPKMTRMILSDSLIYQLAKASISSIKQKYDYTALIIGLIIGALAGALIMFIILKGVV